MTTLTDRPHTALLVIDVQNGVVDGSPRRDEVVANINRLLDKARREQVPVVWVQHASEELTPGSPAWEYVPELVRARASRWCTSGTAIPSRPRRWRRFWPAWAWVGWW